MATGAAHRINLVDEDNTRGFLLGLFKEVADTRGAHADEHLHEVAARHREERHIGLAGHRLGE